MNDVTRESYGTRPIAPDGPLRLGILGFGRLAQNYYVPALRRLGRQLKVCVADPLDSSRAAAIKAFGNVRTYADYRQMLECEQLQAALVATPPSRHLEIWRATTAFGFSVFMEKPFLLPDELDRIETADPAWQNLMINFNRRFWPTYRALGERVADGSLGRVSHARFTLNVDVGKWSTASDHRAQACEGGVLYDLGSQVLDLVFVTFRQRPTEILARRSGSGGLDDRVDLTLRFPDGLIVDCDLAYGRRNRESVMIQGENAVLHLRNPNFLAWVEHNPSPLIRLVRSTVDFAAIGYRGFFRSRSMLRYSVCASLEAFFRTLGTTRPFSTGFVDALRVAVCARAATQSVAQGRAISLDSMNL